LSREIDFLVLGSALSGGIGGVGRIEGRHVHDQLVAEVEHVQSLGIRQAPIWSGLLLLGVH